MIVHSSCCPEIFRKTTNAKTLLVLVFVLYNTTASFALDPADPIARPLPVGTRVGLWVPAGPPEVEPAIGEALLHPILKTPDFHGFEGKPISPEFFKSLNSNLRLYRFAQNRYGSLAKRCNKGSFRPAEVEVGQRFCNLAKGLTEAEIVDLAGRPTAILAATAFLSAVFLALRGSPAEASPVASLTEAGSLHSTRNTPTEVKIPKSSTKRKDNKSFIE
jgi:hypothetical protein